MVFVIFFYNQLAYALYFVFWSFEIFVYLSVARLFTLLGNKFFFFVDYTFDGFLLNISLNLKTEKQLVDLLLFENKYLLHG